MKKAYESKTIWFNIITAVVTVATLYGYREDPEVVKDVAVVAGGLAPLVNVLLRRITKTAITLY